MQDNYTILTKAWLEGTSDFQQRIPNPAQYGLAATVNAINDPLNNDLWNQFSNSLNNTIGYSIISALRWENPYNVLRLANLQWGNSIREIMPKWMRTHTYSDESKRLLDVEKADFAQMYYSVNYEAKIPWDLNRAELLRAMSGPDGSNAINDLYLATATAALNTDDLNIAEACTDCLRQADTRWDGGLYRYSVPTTDDVRKDARNLLRAIRKFTYDLKWPSQQFNHVDVPVFANNGLDGRPNELFLFVDSEEMASLEIDAYAELFNMSVAEVRARIMVLPKLPIPDARAILTTDTLIHWHDTVYGIFSFFNIDTLNDKQILHHQAIIAPNPSVPCIVLTSEAGTVYPVVKMTAQKLTLNPASSTVEPGGEVQLNPRLEGTITDNEAGLTVRPDAALYTIAVSKGEKNTRTYVDKFGVLHVQKTGIPVGATITVTAASIYTDPTTNVAEPITASTTITVAAKEVEGVYTVSYNVAGDTTYGIPDDAPVPESVLADAGVTVTLAPKPATSWTTSDGTASGVAGTWTFTGWGSTSAVSDTITEVETISADKTVYGKWAFAAS